MRFKVAVKNYHQNMMRSKLSQSTKTKYSNISYGMAHNRKYANREIDSITPQELNGFVLAFRDKYGTYVPTVLRNILKFSGYPDLARQVITPRLYKERGEIPTWTQDEVKFFIKNANKLSAHIAECAYLTAQRVSDLVHIHWDNVDSGLIAVHQKKTNYVAYVPMTQRLYRLFEAGGDCGWLVHDPFKNKLNPNAARYLIKKEIKNLNMRPELSIHGLRKARAAYLAAKGCSVYEIAAVTGHANPQSLNIYTKLYDRREASRNLLSKIS